MSIQWIETELCTKYMGSKTRVVKINQIVQQFAQYFHNSQKVHVCLVIVIQLPMSNFINNVITFNPPTIYVHVLYYQMYTEVNLILHLHVGRDNTNLSSYWFIGISSAIVLMFKWYMLLSILKTLVSFWFCKYYKWRLRTGVYNNT